MRLLALLILPGLCAAQSPTSDSPPPPVMISARAPDLAAMLRRLESARSREDEPELRNLAQKFTERAQAHPPDAESFFAAARAHNALLDLYVLHKKKDRARQQLDLVALKGLKKNEEARKAFQEVLRLDPENVRAARELAALK